MKSISTINPTITESTESLIVKVHAPVTDIKMKHPCLHCTCLSLAPKPYITHVPRNSHLRGSREKNGVQRRTKVSFANCSSSNAHIMVLPKFTFIFLYSSFLSPLPRRWQFMIVLLCGLMEDLVTAVIVEVFITLSFCLKMLDNTKTKSSRPFTMAHQS